MWGLGNPVSQQSEDRLKQQMGGGVLDARRTLGEA